MKANIGVAKGVESLSRLNAARALLDKFADQNADALDQRQRDLLNEGRFRTRQMARLLEIVIQLMAQGEPGSIDIDRMLDLQTMTESFYYLAHRALKALQEHPQIKDVKANGISIVRNQLLEHADGKRSGVLHMTFMWSGFMGPIVKGVRLSDQAELHPGAGLWADVDEFCASLSSILTPLVK